MEYFLDELQHLIGIAISVVLGFAIGFERKMRSKEAGIRTHTIVCAGSALMVVVSKFGFGGQGDAARVAAQIVSGVGFLGAGMIVYRQQSIHGLTTAAGVWATAGVGMAAGAGLYIVATGATLILILVQFIFHSRYKIFHNKKSYKYNVSFVQTESEEETIRQLFGVDNFYSVNVKSTENGVQFDVCVITDRELRSNWLASTITENPYIISIRRVEDN